MTIFALNRSCFKHLWSITPLPLPLQRSHFSSALHYIELDSETLSLHMLLLVFFMPGWFNGLQSQVNELQLPLYTDWAPFFNPFSVLKFLSNSHFKGKARTCIYYWLLPLQQHRVPIIWHALAVIVALGISSLLNGTFKFFLATLSTKINLDR